MSQLVSATIPWYIVTVFPDKIFPWHFPGNSLTKGQFPDISLTAAKFSDISRFSIKYGHPVYNCKLGLFSNRLFCCMHWHILVPVVKKLQTNWHGSHWHGKSGKVREFCCWSGKIFISSMFFSNCIIIVTFFDPSLIVACLGNLNVVGLISILNKDSVLVHNQSSHRILKMKFPDFPRPHPKFFSDCL